MTHTVLDRRILPIRIADDIVLVRNHVRDFADAGGFDPFARLAVTTASSELARNTLVHGRGGHAYLERICDPRRFGVRAEFHDRGPGIVDLARALAGGHSTGGSLGLGLSGSRRLVDELDIDSKVGQGTIVRFVKWGRPSVPSLRGVNPE
jgi:serine/threonine-protein kinase RsbT